MAARVPPNIESDPMSFEQEWHRIRSREWKVQLKSDGPCRRSGGWWSPGSSCWSVRVSWSGRGASAASSGRPPRPPRAWWRTRHPRCSWCPEDSAITSRVFHIRLNQRPSLWLNFATEQTFLIREICQRISEKGSGTDGQGVGTYVLCCCSGGEACFNSPVGDLMDYTSQWDRLN